MCVTWARRLSILLLSTWALFLPGRMPVSAAAVTPTAALAAAAAHGGSPWSRLRKPLHRFVACVAGMLGVTGIVLAFAAGPWLAVGAWAVAGLALYVCAG